jgi:hypothetical protein
MLKKLAMESEAKDELDDLADDMSWDSSAEDDMAEDDAHDHMAYDAVDVGTNGMQHSHALDATKDFNQILPWGKASNSILNDMIKLATMLDSKCLTKESDQIDLFIQKIANQDESWDYSMDMALDHPTHESNLSSDYSMDYSMDMADDEEEEMDEDDDVDVSVVALLLDFVSSIVDGDFEDMQEVVKSAAEVLSAVEGMSEEDEEESEEEEEMEDLEEEEEA